MGAYLNKPVTNKDVENASNHNLSYSCTSMQGWRTSQEDAHNAILDFGENISLFAVYDGHGGSDVAKLCADYLPEHIKKHEDFIKGEISQSLEKSFIEFDRSILSPETQQILKKIANIDVDQDLGSDSDENHNLLQEEARMPLEQVLEKYVNDQDNSKEDDSGQETETKKTSTSKVLKLFRKVYSEKIEAFDSIDNKNIDDIYENDDDDDSEDYVAEDEKEEEDEEEEEDYDDDDDDDEEEDIDNEDNDLDEEDEDEGIMSTMDMLENTPGFNSGSTAVLSLIDFKEGRIYVANAGDSRCVMCRNGQTVELSQDHKPEDKIETDRIIKAGGQLTEDGRVNGGLNLSRSIGDHYYKNNTGLSLEEQMISALPDVKVINYLPSEDEFMVLACDGIWNSMSSEEVVDFVKSRIDKMDLESIVSEMFKHCLAPNTNGDGTGCDNMTCIIVKFKRFSDQNGEKHCNGSSADVQSKPSNDKASSNQSPVKRKLTNEDNNGDTPEVKPDSTTDSAAALENPSAKLRKVITSETNE